MKTLSLLQPWASLVVMGFKTIETRSWNTKHRGELLIHASLGKKASVLVHDPPFNKYIKDFNALPFGAIVGKVVLEDVLAVEQLFYSDAMMNKLTLEEKAFGDYAKGRFAWILSHPEQFTDPILVKGGLGLWEFSI